MVNKYNKHYKKENYFGNPYPGLVEFFKAYPERNRVLDLGCGQGRDSLTLGRLGYSVVGVDLSEVGIGQLNKVAEKESLDVKGVVLDIYDFKITQEFDMVLMDSIFHFYKKDYQREKDLLLKVVNELKTGGVLCNFIFKGKKREKDFKDIISKSGVDFELISEGYINYPEYDGEFLKYIIKKL